MATDRSFLRRHLRSSFVEGDLRAVFLRLLLSYDARDRMKCPAVEANGEIMPPTNRIRFCFIQYHKK